MAAVRGYQRWISPLSGPRCKYYPTCSAYALSAINIHGAIKGLILAVWRLARCNPWSNGGLDYVPLKGQWRPGPSERLTETELTAYWRALDAGQNGKANDIVETALAARKAEASAGPQHS
ncbi:MAG: membrane protein insertion efficiency factor YidD [Winkia neuii]|uniref:Putative membrane protein insertion efficiency factor n=1 Tax=Winkia neuii TaxID=33007 RepID=A0A2I1IQZ0_9ACTO|nr:membrane protein insertion efficiency factor YidD [Winkia neuii]OFJ72404.1 hypothetical protein HMPREF2851_03945 [Actinomyces sp. HMSC064C12]OFT54286.1 hypothetical protein HMPREF3152_09535 [Actinomyces sp. HMSC06A08]MDK8100436.1 membrane protein insertion efficiency factor YidD [Winkia neuii]MDU3134224.1 membrane protein insertion efficiency factor YidD [Winkia neuii]PKY73543.1 membrane protein insertion efficiency factor YidD [Winkia neuii]